VTRVLNTTAANPWTAERLRRSVKRLVRERLADKEPLKMAPARNADDQLLTVVAGIALANTDLSLREIAAQLEKMRERDGVLPESQSDRFTFHGVILNTARAIRCARL
jgi:hypothetical protein